MRPNNDRNQDIDTLVYNKKKYLKIKIQYMEEKLDQIKRELARVQIEGYHDYDEYTHHTIRLIKRNYKDKYLYTKRRLEDLR